MSFRFLLLCKFPLSPFHYNLAVAKPRTLDAYVALGLIFLRALALCRSACPSPRCRPRMLAVRLKDWISLVTGPCGKTTTSARFFHQEGHDSSVSFSRMLTFKLVNGLELQNAKILSFIYNLPTGILL